MTACCEYIFFWPVPSQQSWFAQLLINLYKIKNYSESSTPPTALPFPFGAQTLMHQILKRNTDKVKHCAKSGNFHLVYTKLQLALGAGTKIEPTYRGRERRRRHACGPVHPLWAEGKWVSSLRFRAVVVFWWFFWVLCSVWSILTSLFKLTILSVNNTKWNIFSQKFTSKDNHINTQPASL